MRAEHTSAAGKHRQQQKQLARAYTWQILYNGCNMANTRFMWAVLAILVIVMMGVLASSHWVAGMDLVLTWTTYRAMLSAKQTGRFVWSQTGRRKRATGIVWAKARSAASMTE